MNDAYQDTVNRIEPDIAMIDNGAANASVSISLKRLADAESTKGNLFDLGRKLQQEGLIETSTDGSFLASQAISLKRIADSLFAIHLHLLDKDKRSEDYKALVELMEHGAKLEPLGGNNNV